MSLSISSSLTFAEEEEEELLLSSEEEEALDPASLIVLLYLVISVQIKLNGLTHSQIITHFGVILDFDGNISNSNLVKLLPNGNTALREAFFSECGNSKVVSILLY